MYSMQPTRKDDVIQTIPNRENNVNYIVHRYSLCPVRVSVDRKKMVTVASTLILYMFKKCLTYILSGIAFRAVQ